MTLFRRQILDRDGVKSAGPATWRPGLTGCLAALPGELERDVATRRIVQVLACIAGTMGGNFSPALAAGDAAAGKAFAEHWCACCHIVTPEQKTATTEAPPFATIAARHTDSIDALAAFLADPHPPMPQMSLTRQEIPELLAYIGSLR